MSWSYLGVPVIWSTHVEAAKRISLAHFLYLKALQNLITIHLEENKLFSVNEADHYFSIRGHVHRAVLSNSDAQTRKSNCHVM